MQTFGRNANGNYIASHRYCLHLILFNIDGRSCDVHIFSFLRKDLFNLGRVATSDQSSKQCIPRTLSNIHTMHHPSVEPTGSSLEDHCVPNHEAAREPKEIENQIVIPKQFHVRRKQRRFETFDAGDMHEI